MQWDKKPEPYHKEDDYKKDDYKKEHKVSTLVSRTDILLTLVQGPFWFTSTYDVYASPDTIINNNQTRVPGVAGASGSFKFGINSGTSESIRPTLY